MASDHCTLSTLIGGRIGANLSLLHTMLEGSKFVSHYAKKTNGIYECKIDIKSTWIFFMVSNGLFFMVTSIISKNHLFKVHLQNWRPWQSKISQLLILLHFIMCEDPPWIDISWNNIWLKAISHMISYCTQEPLSTLHDFGNVLGWPFDTSFGLWQFHGHGFWVVYEVILNKDI